MDRHRRRHCRGVPGRLQLADLRLGLRALPGGLAGAGWLGLADRRARRLDPERRLHGRQSIRDLALAAGVSQCRLAGPPTPHLQPRDWQAGHNGLKCKLGHSMGAD